MKVEIRDSNKTEEQYPLTVKDLKVGQFVESEYGDICLKVNHENHGYPHDWVYRTSDWKKGWCAGWTKFRALPNKEVVFALDKEGL